MRAKPFSPRRDITLTRAVLSSDATRRRVGRGKEITMMLDAAFAALVEARLGTRWHRVPDVDVDDRLRRDIGLPPRELLPRLHLGQSRR